MFFHFLTCLLISLAGLLPPGMAVASTALSGAGGGGAGNEMAPMVTTLPPIAIGAIQPAEKRLARPRQEVVERSLRKQGKIVPGMTHEQVRSAVKAYYHDFYKASSVDISQEIPVHSEQRVSESIQNASTMTTQTISSGSASKAVQAVTAKILGLAADFGGNDTFTYSAPFGSGCRSETVTTRGPRKGQIMHPGPNDNNTIWYDPVKTAHANFYEKLIFGYQGVGRVRYDLRDPIDHKPGINLSGYTVQDYYDHMAGKGNVVLSGVVKGWVTVDHSEGYYGAPSCSGHKVDGGGPVAAPQLARDALQKFMQAHPDYYNDTSPDAFWKQYDADHNGIVDSFWLIHAGMGQEEGGGAQGDFAIWSYSGNLGCFKVYEGDPGTTADDICVSPYVVLPEDVGLGVLVEECGHNLFSLPDLYTNDIDNSVGFWSIMSAGTWAGWLGGATPVGIPLFFRMIAQCGGQPCNWQEPILTLPYNSPARSVKIGQLETTPSGVYKGVKVELPDYVDTTGSYTNYYLVEWRTDTKYDKMIKTAYVTTYVDADEWGVQRVPYNIPGAVIYYYNEKYSFTGALKSYLTAPPSIGPKYPLLVVDMNYAPLRLGDTGIVLDARKGSYDAALTLQPTKPFALTQIDQGGIIVAGPWNFPSKPAVRQFDDAKGYFGGFYAGPPCGEGAICSASDNGSTVLPAFGSYSTRITHYDSTPYTELYGEPYRGSILGSGNPGDDGVQYGLRIKLQGKSRNGQTATLLFNGPHN
jgi:M6 family metalloprotease-like protein